MSIAIRCPHCSALLRVDESYTGRTGTCPQCKNSFAIAALGAAPEVMQTRPVTIPSSQTPPPVPISQPVQAPSVAPDPELASFLSSLGQVEGSTRSSFNFTQSPHPPATWPPLPFSQTMEVKRSSFLKTTTRYTISIESPKKVLLLWQNFWRGRPVSKAVQVDLTKYHRVLAWDGEPLYTYLLRSVVLLALFYHWRNRISANHFSRRDFSDSKSAHCMFPGRGGRH